MDKRKNQKKLKWLQEKLPHLFLYENGELLFLKDQSPMIYVPSGSYKMGASIEHLFAHEYEKPQIEIKLTAFLIDKFPVTVKRYREFINTGGYQEENFWSNGGVEFLAQKVTSPLMWDEHLFKKDNYPVAGVSYYEAEAYCNWAGKKLPTEAQWETSARGPVEKSNREFPWGDAFPGESRLNFDENIGHVTSVHRYPLGKSGFGLFDMAGNVNNWCRDWFLSSYYTHFGETSPTNPEIDDTQREKITKETNVLLAKKSDRGGGFLTTVEAWPVLTCYARLCWTPLERQAWHGFRGVWEIPEDILEEMEKMG